MDATRRTVTMTVKTMIAAAISLATVVAADAQQRVTVVGCPSPGVEAKCLVLRGSDNVTYNISEARQRPEIGQRAIQLTGTPTKKMSVCNQGIVLTNISWTYTSQSCR